MSRVRPWMLAALAVCGCGGGSPGAKGPAPIATGPPRFIDTCTTTSNAGQTIDVREISVVSDDRLRVTVWRRDITFRDPQQMSLKEPELGKTFELERRDGQLATFDASGEPVAVTPKIIMSRAPRPGSDLYPLRPGAPREGASVGVAVSELVEWLGGAFEDPYRLDRQYELARAQLVRSESGIDVYDVHVRGTVKTPMPNGGAQGVMDVDYQGIVRVRAEGMIVGATLRARERVRLALPPLIDIDRTDVATVTCERTVLALPAAPVR